MLRLLKPRVATQDTSTARASTARIGATPRQRGRPWLRRRAAWLSAHPLCATCEAEGRLAAAQEVDHIIPLSQGGADDEANLQGLCVPCHRAKSAREAIARHRNLPLTEQQAYIQSLLWPVLQPAKAELTIVCGPAGGGKSTYIRQHATADDLVIDMDMIRAELRISDGQWDQSTLIRSLLRRNELLASLAASEGKAWFIVSAAKGEERRWWRTALRPKRMVIVLAGEATCLARIKSTRKDERATRSLRAASKWWAEFTNYERDHVVDTATIGRPND